MKISILMNNDKVPFKYLLNLWKSRPNYPTKLDVLYEVYSYVLKNMKGQEFSEQTFNSIWPDSSGVANWKGTPIEPHLNEMLSDGTFVKTKESGDKQWYRIDEVRNPFI